jgi:hypothetical protein
MDQSKEVEQKSKKGTWLDHPVVAALVVPIGIVLIGGLIVVGIARLLNTERTYEDLINEIDARQFGNKWVSAYELSKLLASSQIPESEKQNLVRRLSAVYQSGADEKTRNFLIVALASLNHPDAVETLQLALKDPDPKVVFNALAGLGNLPKEYSDLITWSEVFTFLEHEDPGLQQVAALTIGQHFVPEGEVLLVKLLASPSRAVKYSASMALINYKNKEILPIIPEILNLDYPETIDEAALGFNQVEVEGLKLSVIDGLMRNKWRSFNESLYFVSKNDPKARVSTKAKEALNLLKN